MHTCHRGQYFCWFKLWPLWQVCIGLGCRSWNGVNFTCLYPNFFVYVQSNASDHIKNIQINLNFPILRHSLIINISLIFVQNKHESNVGQSPRYTSKIYNRIILSNEKKCKKNPRLINSYSRIDSIRFHSIN